MLIQLNDPSFVDTKKKKFIFVSSNEEKTALGKRMEGRGGSVSGVKETRVPGSQGRRI